MFVRPIGLGSLLVHRWTTGQIGGVLRLGQVVDLRGGWPFVDVGRFAVGQEVDGHVDEWVDDWRWHWRRRKGQRANCGRLRYVAHARHVHVGCRWEAHVEDGRVFAVAWLASVRP